MNSHIDTPSSGLVLYPPHANPGRPCARGSADTSSHAQAQRFRRASHSESDVNVVVDQTVGKRIARDQFSRPTAVP